MQPTVERDHSYGDGYPLGSGPDPLTLHRVDSHALEDREIDGLLPVLARAFNGGPSWFTASPSPRDHLVWKVIDRPGGGTVDLIRSEDSLVGCQFSVHQRFLLNGRAAIARQGMDLALAPEAQGRGINSSRRAVERLLARRGPDAFAVGFGAHPLSRGRRGTSDSLSLENPVETLMRPLRPRDLLGAAVARRRRAPAQLGGSRTRASVEAQTASSAPISAARRRAGLAARLGAAALTHPVRRDVRAWTIGTVDRLGPEADELWNEAARDFDLIQVRDQQYLNWRFRDARGGRFLVRAAQLDGRMLGYAALRLSEDGGGALADLLALPGRADVVRSLVQDACAVAASRGAPYLRTWLPRHHPYRDALRAEGFVPYTTPLRASLRSITEGPVAAEVASLAAATPARASI